MNFINMLKFSQGTINNYCTRVNNSYELYTEVKIKIKNRDDGRGRRGLPPLKE